MIYNAVIAPFAEFDFMRRALTGVVTLAIGSAPVGIFLMLRRMSLTGDAMAHAILPGAAIGYLVAGLSVPAMTIGGLAAGFLIAILAGVVSRLTELREDASLAALYLISLALGVTLVSLRGSNIDLMHVLFGSVLALDNEALVLLASSTTITLFVLAIFYRPLVLECVDPGFLRSLSRSGSIAHLAFLGLVVINLVAGFQALGTLLAVGLMMLPAASARFWVSDITPLIAVSTLIGMVSGIGGLLFSYHAGMPSGPAIILSAGIFYLLSVAIGPQGGLLHRLLPKKHLDA